VALQPGHCSREVGLPCAAGWFWSFSVVIAWFVLGSALSLPSFRVRGVSSLLHKIANPDLIYEEYARLPPTKLSTIRTEPLLQCTDLAVSPP
jgi:hypothetical protein